MWVTIVAVVVFLIALNALYVAAEFGSVSARKSRLRVMADEGSRLAAALLPLIEQPERLDRYIAASQIGITFSSLVLGAFGQSMVATSLVPLFERFGQMGAVAAQSSAAIIVLVVLAALQMVLGELVPKQVALRYPVRTALFTSVPMRWSLHVFSWFISFLNGSGIALLRMLGIDAKAHRHVHSADEIELLLSEAGELAPDDHDRLRKALHLGNRPVRQLMVPRRRIAAVRVDAPLTEAYRRVAMSPYTRMPVYRDTIDDVVGILHTRDLVEHYVSGDQSRSLESLLRPVTHVPETASGDQVLHALREERTHLAIVVDEFGGVAGLVTLEDLLADVLGGMSDELKESEPEPERLPDGRIRLPGMLRLYEAEPWVGRLWDGESDTVGGLVAEVLGHLPSPGETVLIDGVSVEVERVEEHVVVSVLASSTPGLGEERS